MNTEKILASFSIEVSEKEGMAYTCDQMIRLFIRAKLKGQKFVIPANCQKDEIDKFAEFINKYYKAFTGTVKGLDNDWFAGESLMSPDQKELFLFVFACDDTPVMVKGIKNKKKDISLLPDGRNVSLGSSLGLGEGPGSLWMFLKKSDLDSLCTVISIKCSDAIELYKGTGAPITQN